MKQSFYEFLTTKQFLMFYDLDEFRQSSNIKYIKKLGLCIFNNFYTDIRITFTLAFFVFQLFICIVDTIEHDITIQTQIIKSTNLYNKARPQSAISTIKMMALEQCCCQAEKVSRSPLPESTFLNTPFAESRVVRWRRSYHR